MRKAFVPLIVALGLGICGPVVAQPDDPGNLLYRAVVDNDILRVTELLQQHAATLRKDQFPLQYARSAEVVQLLLAAGAPVDGTNENFGPSPLGNAVKEDRREVALALIKAGADLKKMNDGFPPLYLAASRDKEIVAALLAAGADPDWTRPEEDTPLCQAIKGKTGHRAAADRQGRQREPPRVHVDAARGGRRQR